MPRLQCGWFSPGAAGLVAALLLLTAFPAGAGALPLTSAANTPHAGRTWHGVSTATLELSLSSGFDICLGGPMTLGFGRTYASILEREGEALGSMGTNWLGTYDWRLVENAVEAKVVDNRGRVYRFAPGRNGWDLVSPQDAAWQLTDLGTEAAFVHVRHRMFYILDRSTGRLVRIEDTHGNQHLLSYANGRLQTVSDTYGRSLTFSYDALGRVSGVSDGSRSVGYGYTGSDLTSCTDAAGKTTTYEYDTNSPVPGLLTRWIDPVGASPLHYAYDSSGLVSEVHDLLTTLAAFSVTADTPTGATVAVTVPDGGVHTFTHDAAGRLTEYLDPANGSTAFEYDTQGRLLSITRPSGVQPAQYGYDSLNGTLSEIILGDGESYQFVSEGRSFTLGTLFYTTLVVAPDQTQAQFVYDAAGDLTKVTDPESFEWILGHNAAGQVTSLTNPTQGVTSFTYDTLGRLETSNDGAGTTTYSYDALDRLAGVVHPDQSSRTFLFDNRNLLTEITNELGKTWSFEYRDNGQPWRATDPLGVIREYEYDGLNRVSGAGIPAAGSMTTFGWDPSWRLETATDPTSRTTTFGYDQLGRLTTLTDAGNHTTTYAFDADGLRVGVTDPLNHTWSLDHDLRERLSSATDPLGHTTGYQYDAVGNRTAVTRPLGLNSSYTYDARGNLTAATLGPIGVGFSYTPLGRLETFTDGEQNDWTRSYDPQGRLMTSTDPLSRTIEYSYDNRNRLSGVTHPEGSATFDHDPAGRLTLASYSDGTTFGYSYDDMGRLLATDGVSRSYDDLNRTITENGIVYGYDAAGRLVSEMLGPNQTVVHTYDQRGLLSTTTDWLGGTTGFSFDDAGRLTGITRPNGTEAGYSYDDDDRIKDLTETEGTTPLAKVSLVRDALGRVVVATRQLPHPWDGTTPDTSFAYDAASQVVGLTYDGLGRLVSDGVRSFAWNGASLPDSIDDGTEMRNLDPDGLGRVRAAMPSFDPSTPYVLLLHAPDLAGIANPSASFGGRAAEAESPSATRVPERLRHRNRAVSLADFGRLASDLPGVKIARASATPNGPGVDTDHWITTPAGLLLHAIDLRGVPPVRRYFHFDERGNTMFRTDDGGNVVSAYGYSVEGRVSRTGEAQHYPRYTFGAAFGTTEEAAGGGIYRQGARIYLPELPSPELMEMAMSPLAEPGLSSPAPDVTDLFLGDDGSSFQDKAHRLSRGRRTKTFLGASASTPAAFTMFKRDGVPLRAAAGPMPQTREHILLSRQVGASAADGHEVGHWLGLWHTYPSASAGDGTWAGLVGDGTWGPGAGDGVWGSGGDGIWGSSGAGIWGGSVGSGVWGGHAEGRPWGGSGGTGITPGNSGSMIFGTPTDGPSSDNGGHEVGHWLGMAPPGVVAIVPPRLDDRHFRLCDPCDDDED